MATAKEKDHALALLITSLVSTNNLALFLLAKFYKSNNLFIGEYPFCVRFNFITPFFFDD